jgi:integrase
MSRRRRRTTARVYIKGRDRLGRPLYYGDFRAYRTVGGRLEALKAVGERRATSSAETAEELFALRLAELKRLLPGARFASAPAVRAPLCLVAAFQRHLELRAASGNFAHGTLCNDEKAAKNLHRILGDIPLKDIDASVLATYVKERMGGGRQDTQGPLSVCTLRNELHSLSSLLARAVFEGELSKHPMKGWTDLPDAPRSRRRYLSREDARALLKGAEAEDARVRARWMTTGPSVITGRSAGGCGKGGTPVPTPPQIHTFAATLVATLLYTGGRSREITGLEVRDLDFDAGVVRIRPNRFRRLKRDWAERTVPMPPPLARRLTEHIASRRLRPEDALFPNTKGLAIATINGMLRRCAALGHLSPTGLSAHCLRHTFATVMLRTLTKTAEGVSILHSPYEVAKLLGHRRSDLVETVYAHWNPTMPIERRLDFEPRPLRPPSPSRGGRRTVPDLRAGRTGRHPERSGLCVSSRERLVGSIGECTGAIG